MFSSSVTGAVALPNCSAYAVTKAGLRHMAKVLAIELGQHGITVNALGMSATRTSATCATIRTTRPTGRA